MKPIAAYAANKDDVIHAQCWAHTRRGFEQAEASEPAASAEALVLIGALYRHEPLSASGNSTAKQNAAYRTEHSEPIVKAFWHWCDDQCHRAGSAAEQPAGQGHAVCQGAVRESGGIPRRIPMCRSTPTIWSAAFAPFRWEGKTGSSAGPRSVPSGSRHPEPAGDLPFTGRRSLHLPGRCTATHQRTPGE